MSPIRSFEQAWCRACGATILPAPEIEGAYYYMDPDRYQFTCPECGAKGLTTTPPDAKF